jgi:hypothetical protein
MKDTSRMSRLPTALLDAGYLVVVVAGLPLWAILLLVYAAVILFRQLYWWARANTTATSRVLGSLTPASITSGTRTP